MITSGITTDRSFIRSSSMFFFVVVCFLTYTNLKPILTFLCSAKHLPCHYHRILPAWCLVEDLFLHFLLLLYVEHRLKSFRGELFRRTAKTGTRDNKIYIYICICKREKACETFSLRRDASLLALGHLSETNYFSVANSL